MQKVFSSTNVENINLVFKTRNFIIFHFNYFIVIVTALFLSELQYQVTLKHLIQQF